MSAQGGQALVAAERAGQADQDGRPCGAALPSIDLSVVRGVGSSTVVPRSVGSYRPVIAGAKLREGTTTILPRGGERSRESACLQCAFTPLAGARRRQRGTRSMVHGKKRIPYRIDRRLTGLAGPEYHAIISFGLPIEPEDSQYGEYRVDGYLGQAGSPARKGASTHFGQMRGKVNSCRTRAEFDELFCQGN